MKVAALIVAAGRGSRAGGDLPKQYQPLLGELVLRHTLRAFCDHDGVDLVQTVVGEGVANLYEEAAADLDVLPAVLGGETRQASVSNGLMALADSAPDLVLIHDGARACVDAATISRVIEKLQTQQAAIAALPVSDTLKKSNGGAGPDRDGLWRAQTPQGFHFKAIRAAHAAATGSFTDDAAVAEAAGMTVALVQGSEDNIKITYEADFARAAMILLARKGGLMKETRVGLGLDVHRFEPGTEITLCGVTLPHTQQLVGHSDADVALHALTDAVLGAIGEGDIGTHFPPSDAQWKGASSDQFLSYAVSLVAARGGRITHLDVTMICEAPKITPHRDAMCARLSDICDLEKSRISVKATTTEKLGFTGRGEGIEARAVATIELPRI